MVRPGSALHIGTRSHADVRSFGPHAADGVVHVVFPIHFDDVRSPKVTFSFDVDFGAFWERWASVGPGSCHGGGSCDVDAAVGGEAKVFPIVAANYARIVHMAGAITSAGLRRWERNSIC